MNGHLRTYSPIQWHPATQGGLTIPYKDRDKGQVPPPTPTPRPFFFQPERPLAFFVEKINLDWSGFLKLFWDDFQFLDFLQILWPPISGLKHCFIFFSNSFSLLVSRLQLLLFFYWKNIIVEMQLNSSIQQNMLFSNHCNNKQIPYRKVDTETECNEAGMSLNTKNLIIFPSLDFRLIYYLIYVKFRMYIWILFYLHLYGKYPEILSFIYNPYLQANSHGMLIHAFYCQFGPLPSPHHPFRLHHPGDAQPARRPHSLVQDPPGMWAHRGAHSHPSAFPSTVPTGNDLNVNEQNCCWTFFAIFLQTKHRSVLLGLIVSEESYSK